MDKKKISYLILLCLFSLSCTLQAEKYETVSPNGKLKIKLKIDKGTQYEVWYDNTQLILPSPRSAAPCMWNWWIRQDI